jgi:hypothetical protein
MERDLVELAQFDTRAKLFRNRERTGMKLLATAVLLALVLLTVACSHRDNVSYLDSVEKALQQSELPDVTVSEDQDKNTITLGGTLHSDETKSKAAEIAKAAAGTRIMANEISVQPVGSESQAKDVASGQTTHQFHIDERLPDSHGKRSQRY